MFVHCVRSRRVSNALSVAFFAGAAIALVGCAPSPFENASYTELTRHDLSQLTRREESLLGRADGLSRSAAATADSSALATIEDCVALALEQNPSIAAARQRVLRLQERLPQVSSLDDPMLKISPVGEMAETAAGQVQAMTSLSQKFPFPGKLDTRKQVAAQDVAIAEHQLDEVRLGVIADTRQAYWSLYDAVQAIEITTQSQQLLSQLSQVVQAKYRAGTATQESVLRISVELNNLNNELIELSQHRRTAAGMLNALLDRAIDAPIPDPAPLDLRLFDSKLADLLVHASATNPAIKTARQRIERFAKQRELARLNRYPDLTTSISYNLVDSSGLSKVANGDDQWWLGFGINLPIWQDRLDAAEREAVRGVLETSSQLAAAQNRIAFRVQDAYLKIESKQQQALLLRDAIVPEAAQTVDASLSEYRSGKVDFLTLIDNWRKLLTFQLMYQHTLSSLEQSFAALEEAVGQDLAENPKPDHAQETVSPPTPNTPDSPDLEGSK